MSTILTSRERHFAFQTDQFDNMCLKQIFVKHKFKDLTQNNIFLQQILDNLALDLYFYPRTYKLPKRKKKNCDRKAVFYLYFHLLGSIHFLIQEALIKNEISPKLGIKNTKKKNRYITIPLKGLWVYQERQGIINAKSLVRAFCMRKVLQEHRLTLLSTRENILHEW